MYVCMYDEGREWRGYRLGWLPVGSLVLWRDVRVRVSFLMQGDRGCYRDALGVWRGYRVSVCCEVAWACRGGQP
jgi:hypothetical protein